MFLLSKEKTKGVQRTDFSVHSPSHCYWHIHHKTAFLTCLAC